MGTSYVELGDKGFWMRDQLLQLWLRLLALHVEETVKAESLALARTIRDNWLLQSRLGFNGCMSAGLEEATRTAEGVSIVQGAIASLMLALQRAPAHISGDTLNLLGFEGWRFQPDFETDRLIEVGRAFTDLLNGKIIPEADGVFFMPGSTGRDYFWRARD